MWTDWCEATQQPMVWITAHLAYAVMTVDCVMLPLAEHLSEQQMDKIRDAAEHYGTDMSADDCWVDSCYTYVRRIPLANASRLAAAVVDVLGGP